MRPLVKSAQADFFDFAALQRKLNCNAIRVRAVGSTPVTESSLYIHTQIAIIIIVIFY